MIPTAIRRVAFALMAVLFVGEAAPPTAVDRAIAAAAALENGRPGEALAAYRAILPQLRASPERAQVLSAIAAIETNAGDYAAAIRDGTAAAALFDRFHDVGGRASATNWLGMACMYAGDYQDAETDFRTAISLSRGLHDDRGLAEQVMNLGTVLFYVGRYTEAAAAYDAALQITAAHAAEPWTRGRRQILLVNKAILDQRLGRDREALAIYQQVENETQDLRPRERAQILMNVGVVYRHLGDPVKALATYDEAKRLFAEDHHVDGELGVFKNRGIVLALDLNRLQDAQSTFSEALEQATKAGSRREMLQAQLYRGETELRLGLMPPAVADFTASLDAARALHTPEEQWKALYGLARAELRNGDRAAATTHLREAVAVVEGIRESIKVPTLKSDFFNDKREVYDALISLELQSGDPPRLFELVELSHSRGWRDRLGLRGRITLDAVQNKLPADVLLLDAWSSSFGSAMIAVTRGSATIQPITADPAMIKKLIDVLAAGPSPDWRTLTAAIAGHILPAQLPAGIRHVIVVPDGALTVVPFELLPIDGRMLIEQSAVSYAPTAAMLFRDGGVHHRIVPPWATVLRAFADPVFGSSALGDSAAPLTRLASTAVEVKSVAHEIGGRSILHIGRDDRKTYLFDGAAHTPILHIASHAIADTNVVEQSRILFSPADSSAGADYLFLKEAYTLPLAGVELAVLSACDTERGRLLRGEGVQSFSRAFLAAGARTTVTTFWRVPDEPTADFMKVFYHYLQRGESRAEALRMAKLRFMRSGSELSDPHFWAAFVLTGEGEQPVPTAIRWMSVLLGALALVIVVFAASLFLRSQADSGTADEGRTISPDRSGDLH